MASAAARQRSHRSRRSSLRWSCLASSERASIFTWGVASRRETHPGCENVRVRFGAPQSRTLARRGRRNPRRPRAGRRGFSRTNTLVRLVPCNGQRDATGRPDRKRAARTQSTRFRFCFIRAVRVCRVRGVRGARVRNRQPRAGGAGGVEAERSAPGPARLPSTFQTPAARRKKMREGLHITPHLTSEFCLFSRVTCHSSHASVALGSQSTSPTVMSTSHTDIA